MSTVGSRLGGWLLASAAGTIAVLLFSARPAGDRLRASTGAVALALADELDSAEVGGGSGTSPGATAGSVLPEFAAPARERARAARDAMVAAFSAAPLRPIGLAVPDQALGDLVDVLRWGTDFVGQAVGDGAGAGTGADAGGKASAGAATGTGAAGGGEIRLAAGREADRRLLADSAKVLRDTGALLGGSAAQPLEVELEALDGDSAAELAGFCDRSPAAAVALAFRARLVAAAARNAAADALIVTRRADPESVEAERARWLGAAPPVAGAPDSHLPGGVQTMVRVLRDYAGVRSVWFLNSLRGALAIAAAVAVAQLSDVQHGFWVVLGSLSVLRTNAASTGATALRAIAGTAVGVVVGAVIILAIGSSSGALWALLPVSVFVAAYAPGTAPFAVGQAAFTVTISILFNIIAPVGWHIGVVRIEDVAIGVGVSVLAGVLFWPRGASGVVADDLRDAFHLGGLYLVQATAWAAGLRPGRPDAGAATAQAATRLDAGLRSFMAEQGTRRVPKDLVWRLVGGAGELRVIAQSLAALPEPARLLEPQMRILLAEAVRLAGQCDELAARLGRQQPTVAQELARLPLISQDTPSPVTGYAGFIGMHLSQLAGDLAVLDEPARAVSASRARPWWR
jgi:uncharacterized membrane protein YccC